MIKYGIFTISLDFELAWGFLHKHEKYLDKEKIKCVLSIIPKILFLFKKYEIHATWATVGGIFLHEHEGLKRFKVQNKTLWDKVKNNIYLYISPELIKKIEGSPYQEIASHTFSHYYCLEKKDIEKFEEELKAFSEVTNLSIESIIFPKNQIEKKFLPLCRQYKIKSYRGTPKFYPYKSCNMKNDTLMRRGLRLIDTFINIYGHGTYSLKEVKQDPLYNIASSRFLRPYSKQFQWLESLRQKRILSDLNYAAKHSRVYHLWWHPHNFSKNIKENLLFLEKILIHYRLLNKRYGLKSLNMKEISNICEQDQKQTSR